MSSCRPRRGPTRAAPIRRAQQPPPPCRNRGGANDPSWEASRNPGSYRGRIARTTPPPISPFERDCASARITSPMRLADFDFALPRELIADRPAEPRDSARLLVVPAVGETADRHIADLPQLLRPGDLLVFNDTKVIPARLVGRRGLATVEVTLARDLGGGAWRAYAKGARRPAP